jgi:hypothetical protein
VSAGLNKFDRELQLAILKVSTAKYPCTTEPSDFNKTEVARSSSDVDKLLANVLYLEEHGLIKIEHHIRGSISAMKENLRILSSISATKDGIDFMLQDGGLSAILKVTTIKLHDDTLSLLTEFINKHVESQEDKQKFFSRIRELPYESTKHIALQLVSKGLDQMPNAVQWLKTMIHLA